MNSDLASPESGGTPTPAASGAADVPPATTTPDAKPSGPDAPSTNHATDTVTPPAEAGADLTSETAPPYVLAPIGEMELDPDVVARATPLLTELKGLGMPQETAQKLVEFHANELQAAFTKALTPEFVFERVQEAMTARSEQWAVETKNDPEIGGSKFEATAKAAMNAAGIVGTPAFKKVLIETGLGNNVEFVRVFARLDKILSEDRGGLAPTGDAGVKPLHERFYPGMTSK